VPSGTFPDDGLPACGAPFRGRASKPTRRDGAVTVTKPKETVQQDRADANKDLYGVAFYALSLADNLTERWPIRGQGQPGIGPPSEIDGHEVVGHLLWLQRLLGRFEPPAEHAECLAWCGGPYRVSDPDMTSALVRIRRATNSLSEQFGLPCDAAQVREPWFHLPLFPYAQFSRPWKPRQGLPFPEIDPQDILVLRWAGIKLSEALERAKAAQEPVSTTPENETKNGSVPQASAAVGNTQGEEPDPIPCQFRTRPLSLTEAAKLLGYRRNRTNRQAAKILRGTIDVGGLKCEKRGRQQYIFDRRDFPRESQAGLGPTGPK
jgi:hypothetical protein